MICQSYAKINLHLQVLGLRDDGYHELETLFQTIDLADEIGLELTDSGVSLKVIEGNVPTGERNLAYGAAKKFLERWAPNQGVHISLKKIIPVGGGLGGGSSNAATVLRALRTMVCPEIETGELEEIGADLGADVPFFLSGGTALGLSRGDVISKLPDLASREIILAIPPVNVSTEAVFSDLDLASIAVGRAGLLREVSKQLDWSLVRHGWNDLEKTVLLRYPAVLAVYNALVESGADVVRLSGSGGTLFAIYGDGADHSELSRSLPFGCRLVPTRTVTRSAFRQACAG